MFFAHRDHRPSTIPTIDSTPDYRCRAFELDMDCQANKDGKIGVLPEAKSSRGSSHTRRHARRYSFRRWIAQSAVNVADAVCTQTPRTSSLHAGVAKMLLAGNPAPPPERKRSRLPIWAQLPPDQHPGSAPLPGHVDPELSMHESRLRHAIFNLQAQDYRVVVGGHLSESISPSELKAMLSRICFICTASRTGKRGSIDPITPDTQVLGMMTLLRFLGEVRRREDLGKKLFSSREKELLPEVCLAMASKFEDDRYHRPMDRILNAAGVAREDRAARKRDMSVLEWQVFEGIRYRVDTATPITFLHHYVALAVARGTFTRDEMEPIGKLALGMTMRLVVREGRLARATSSEIAAAAAYSAILQTLGTAAAGRMSTVVRLQWRVPKVQEMVSVLCPGTTRIFVGRDPSAKTAAPDRGSQRTTIAGKLQHLLDEIASLVRKLDCCHPEDHPPSSSSAGSAAGPT